MGNVFFCVIHSGNVTFNSITFGRQLNWNAYLIEIDMGRASNGFGYFHYNSVLTFVAPVGIVILYS